MTATASRSSSQNKVALVTGAARRIGREIALALARDGWDIAVHYRTSRAEADALADEIRALGVRAAVVQADLAEGGALNRLVPECAAALGALTCLVNNASEFLDDTAGTVTEASWATHLDTNLKAPVFLAQAFAKALPAEADGNIINIIDQRVLRPSPEFFSYGIAKAALWSATQTMAQAFAPRIRVNAISPGPVFKSVHQTEQIFEREKATTLLKHGTSADDIARAVNFILASPSMTGTMLTLDAGQHLA